MTTSERVVVRYRGGMFFAWLDGRGHVRGIGKTPNEAVFALRSLL